MIHYLSGTILDIQQNTYLVVANAIGFEVNMPPSYTALPGDQITVFIYPHFTQDNYQLFGFLSKLEKNWFQKLLSISGIGPKTGLQIISKGISNLEKAIVQQDQHFFESISGIGKKTALKILIELAGQKTLPSEKINVHSAYNQAAESLRQLGFIEKDIQTMLVDIPTDLTPGQIVTLALKKHAQKGTN